MNYIKPDWPAPANIKAFTTLRTSWGRVDLPSKGDESTALLTSLLQLPAKPVWLKQTHSTFVVPAEQTTINTEADAAYTHQANCVCVVLTADCLPILITTKDGTHVAAIHAGWRGLAAGIIEATISKMNLLPEQLLVWLGPAIGPSKFEVGQDVYDAFVKNHADAKRAFQSYSSDKWLADLYELARIRFQLLGVKQIYGGEYCTHTETDKFFSYRRDGSITGRMASVIWIAD